MATGIMVVYIGVMFGMAWVGVWLAYYWSPWWLLLYVPMCLFIVFVTLLWVSLRGEKK